MDSDQSSGNSDSSLLLRLDERYQALVRDHDRLERSLKEEIQEVRRNNSKDIHGALEGVRIEITGIKAAMERFVSRDTFAPVSWIAYGLATTTLVAVLGAIVNLVVG